MNIENREVGQNLLNTIEDLRISISQISVYDFSVYSAIELYYNIANKLNEVIKQFMALGINVSEELIKQNECLQYLLNEGLEIEVGKKIDELVADGTMDTIINKNIFKALNDRIANVENTVYRRQFKPKFYVSSYWSETTGNTGTYTMVDENKVDEDIVKWKNHCVDGVTIIIHIGLNTSTNRLFIGADLSLYNQYINKLKDNGLKVYAVKVHKQNMTQSQISNISDFNNQWLYLLREIANNFISVTDRIFCFNEFANLYNNDSNLNFVLNCIQELKNIGFKVGISSQGEEEMYVMRDEIRSSLDILGINHYRYISSKLNKTSNEDSYKSWNNSNVFKILYYLKNHYPNKEVIMSETGVQDYWEALAKPEYFNWSTKSPAGGKAQSIYLYGLLNTANVDYIDAVCWWYNFSTTEGPTSKLLYEYLGGGSNE